MTWLSQLGSLIEQEAEEGGLGEFQLHAEAPTEVEGAVRGGKAEGGFSGRAVGIDLVSLLYSTII